MKIVIASDSFKENLTSLQVATAIESGIKRVLPGARCIKVSMADGGEGTLRSLIHTSGGRYIHKDVCGPLGSSLRAKYGFLSNGETAIIEMAEASGLSLLKENERNPEKTTSYGTGELIVDAIDRGAKKIIVGIGGSATIDGGAGMAQALGVRFINSKGKEIRTQASGGMLNRIKDIDMANLHPGVINCEIIIASDVDCPLCGAKGAAFVFGAQKGATSAMARRLDTNLREFATLVKKKLNIDVKKLLGGGAAGGLGAGLHAFARANIQSGAEIVIQAINLESKLRTADLVFTGEGSIDSQTRSGKTAVGVARAARKYKVPVIAIGGALSDDARTLFDYGIDGLDSAISRPMSLEQAMNESRKFVANSAERAMRLILVGKKMNLK